MPESANREYPKAADTKRYCPVCESNYIPSITSHPVLCRNCASNRKSCEKYPAPGRTSKQRERDNVVVPFNGTRNRHSLPDNVGNVA